MAEISPPRTSFQGLILELQSYWAAQGCVILQPYDMEMGAGTFHPATTLRALGPEPWRAAYVQPSRRPTDGRYGENPNRLQHYYQFQVILKPSPDEQPGSVPREPASRSASIRRCTTSASSRTIGKARRSAPAGLGWEVWCDGMEVTQFTYFQQVGGIECDPVSVELTYGLERLAMYVQGVENVYDLDFNGAGVTYGDVFLRGEREFSAYNFEYADTETLLRHFVDAERECRALLDRNARAAGLRPVHQGEPHVQPAGCARRDQRHRARGLYRARARAGQRLLRGLAGRSKRGRLMAELLLELLSEEIPARMQARAAAELERAVVDRLKEAQLAFTSTESYVTPRRLTLVVEGLPEHQPDIREERRGPRVGAPDQAIQGFLKANGLATLDQCERRKADKGEFWFAVIERKGRPTAEVLPALLRICRARDRLAQIHALGRPARSAGCGRCPISWAIFDGKPLTGSLLGLPFTARTLGHRFHSPATLAVASFEDYRDKLLAAHVILDPAERQRLISRDVSRKGQGREPRRERRSGIARGGHRARGMAGRADG